MQGLRAVHPGMGRSQQSWTGKVLPVRESQLPAALHTAALGKGFGPGRVWGKDLSDPHLSVPCPSRVCSLPVVPNRTQNCTGGSLPPPKIGHLNSKLFLNEIAKKEKQLRKLLEGG